MNYLFLHGLAGSSDDWHNTGKELEKFGHRWLAPSIPYLHNNFSTLADLSAVIRKNIPNEFLGENAIVVGNSLGGSMALQLGSRSQRTVLVASYTSTSTQWIGRSIETLDREINRIFYNKNNIPQSKLEEYKSLWKSLTSNKESFSRLKKIKQAIEKSSLDELYEMQQSKTVFVCGLQDEISPLDNFYMLKNKFPQITINTIDNCGHAIPIEKPTELASILNESFGVKSC